MCKIAGPIELRKGNRKEKKETFPSDSGEHWKQKKLFSNDGSTRGKNPEFSLDRFLIFYFTSILMAKYDSSGGKRTKSSESVYWLDGPYRRPDLYCSELCGGTGEKSGTGKEVVSRYMLTESTTGSTAADKNYSFLWSAVLRISEILSKGAVLQWWWACCLRVLRPCGIDKEELRRT